MVYTPTTTFSTTILFYNNSISPDVQMNLSEPNLQMVFPKYF